MWQLAELDQPTEGPKQHHGQGQGGDAGHSLDGDRPLEEPQAVPSDRTAKDESMGEVTYLT